MSKFLKEFCSPEGLNLSNDQLIVQLKCYNAYGVETKTNLYEGSPDYVNFNVCMLRVQIRNIKSYSNEENLGSVIFCDTFYIQSGAYYILTKGVPYFKCWAIDPSSSESIEKVKDVIVCQEFGKPISPVFDSVNLYVPSTEIFQRSNIEHDIQRVHFTLHENGFKIKSDQWGNFVIFFKDLERVELLRKLNRPTIVLYFKDKPILNSLSADRFYILFSGFAASDVFLQLNNIFNEKEVPYKIVDDFPEELSGNTTLYWSGLLLDRYFKIAKTQASQILDASTFIRFLETQEHLKINNQKDLNFKVFFKIIQAPEIAENQNEPKKVEVFLINGAYSAGKTVFAENLATRGKGLGYTVHIYQKNPKELPSLNNKIFVEGLLSFLRSGVKTGEKVLVVLPSLLNTKLIVDNILRMPEFTDLCEIRTIITKINMNNFYHNSHKEIAENFLTFCNSGYSQFIILDNYGTDDSEIDTLTAALRGLFSYSIIFRINSNMVQQSIAKDILTANNFDLKINKIERKKVIPIKPVEKKYLYIPFKVPLMREKVQSYLYRHVFLENNGYVFPESKDAKPIKRNKVEDELVLLKERINRVNMELSKEIPYIYSINGIVRFEDSLEQVHRLNVNSNYVFEKQIPGVTGSITKSENFDTSDLGLLFYGENLDEEKIRDMLKNVVKPLKSKMKLKTREELTEEQIRELELEFRSWGLEGGTFFDGSRWRDCEGNSLKNHPRLDEIIENYLAEENARVGSVNRQIDKEWKIIEQMWEEKASMP